MRSSLPVSCFGQWAGCTLTTEYPFIGYFPIAFVMSISHVSDCAMMYQASDSGNAT